MIEVIVDIVVQIFAAYIVTLALVASKALKRPREIFKGLTPWLEIAGRHPADCRLCTGFWVSIAVWIIAGVTVNPFLIWGASYFLVTQERK
ncbi:MAG: hypothetical protein KAR40_09700 [Candidatus Sabulitectum sp.]|nr:hypothetical protein [Candidatus Sabulitectum sp.]